MLLKDWLAILNQKPHQKGNRRGNRKRQAAPAEIEVLEDRTLLTAFVVDTLDDTVIEDGFVSLREAILSANQDSPINADVLTGGDPDLDTIHFDSSIAGGTILLDSTLGPLVISDDLFIDGADPLFFNANINISGGGQTQVFAVDTEFAQGSSNVVSFQNLIISNGFASSGNGGGIESRSVFDSLLLGNVDLLNNTADSAGGGLALSGSASVTFSRFFGNFASQGGALAMTGFGSVSLLDSVVGQNSSSIDGGGIWNFGGDVTLGNTVVESNTAGFLGGRGGGISNEFGTVTLTNETQVRGNSAALDGGGLYNNEGVLRIEGSTEIQFNQAAGSGGGIYNSFFGTLSIEETTFLSNVAVMDGGAIANLGTADVTSSIVGPRTRTTTTWERSQVNAGDLVFGMVFDTGFNFNPISLSLRSASGTLDSDTDSFPGPLVAGTTATESGSVFFEVVPLVGDPASDYEIYTAVLDPQSAISELESNDTIGTAQFLSPALNSEGVLVTGDVLQGDTDIFRLDNVAAGSRIVVMLDEDPGRDGFITETELTILDQNGDPVFFGSDFRSHPGNTVPPFEIFASGTYYVRVARNPFLGFDSDYRFAVQVLNDDAQVDLQFDGNMQPLITELMAGEFGVGPQAGDEANRASRGGGIYNAGSLAVSGGSIRSNEATAGGSGGSGGGLYNDGGVATLAMTSIVGNRAAQNGGGIYNAGGDVTISANTSIDSNTALDGGGIYNDLFGNLTVANANFGGNVATGNGGALANFGTATVTSSNIGTETNATDRSDFWQVNNANAGDLIFAYVDTQLATNSSDSTLTVTGSDQAVLEFDDDDGVGAGSLVAGAVVQEAGDVFFEIRGFADSDVDAYRLFAAAVDPNTAIAETLNNDHSISAQLLLPDENGNALVNGTIDSSDVDFYRLDNVTLASQIVVMMDQDPDNDGLSAGTMIELYADDGTTLLASSDTFSSDGTVLGAFEAFYEGTYFIRISNNGLGNDTDYRFLLQVLGAGAGDDGVEIEPNDTIATAQDIDFAGFTLAPNPQINDFQSENVSTSIPHATIQGAGNGTFDYYSFTVTGAGETGIFDIDGASFDTELFLYDAFGNFLAGNDDFGLDVGSNSSLDSFIQYDFTSGGTYVIGVGRFSSTGEQGGITGDVPPLGATYTLNVAISNHASQPTAGGIVDEQEVNDFPATGTRLFAGQFGQGNLGQTRESSAGTNQAAQGGGIWNGDTLLLTASVVQNNEATEQGAGVFNEVGTITIQSTVLINNSAGTSGGGFFNTGFATVESSRFLNNMAGTGDGGGIYNDLIASLSLNESTFEGNRAGAGGGGIANFGDVDSESSIIGTGSGTSASVDDFDYWKRSGALENDLVFAFVDTRNAMFNDDSILSVFGGDFGLLDSDDDDGPGFTSVVAGAEVTTPGDVFFEVSPFGTFESQIDSYQLYTAVVDPTPSVVNIGSTNTRALAQILSDDPQERASGVLVSGDLDDDYFRLEDVPANSVIVVMLDNDPDNDFALSDTDLFLVDANDSIVAFGNNFSGSNANAVVFQTGLTGGDIFIRVTDGAFGADNDYRFVVQVLPAEEQSNPNRIDENETNTLRNDEPDLATMLNAGEFGQGDVGQTIFVGINSAQQGGGIYNDGSFHFRGGTIQNNQADFAGGGVYNGFSGDLEITDSRIAQNTSQDSGGGLYNSIGVVDLLRTQVAGNSAAFDGGGVWTGGLFHAAESSITNNAAVFGAGLYFGFGADNIDSLPTLENVQIADNVASDSGGGIWNNGETLLIRETLISGNTAQGLGGGGLYNVGSARIEQNVQFIDNAAVTEFGFGIGSGGGIYNDFEAILTIIDPAQEGALTPVSTIGFFGNQAPGADGGAIANFGTANLTGVTIGDESRLASPLADLAFFFTGGAEQNDIWRRSGTNMGNLIFAYVDTQLSEVDFALDTDSTLSVLANDGTTLIEFDDDDGSGLRSAVAGASVAQAGNVFFDVRNFGVPDPMAYELFVSVVDPNLAVTETETNDGVLTADAISEDELVVGNLSSLADNDFFSFTVQAGERIVVMLDNDPDRDGLFTSTDLAVLGPSGFSVLSSNLSFFAGANTLGAIEVDTAGTYYVRVRDGGFGSDTDYQFVVQVLDDASLTNESADNDATAGATELPAGQFGRGRLEVGGSNFTNPVSNRANRGGGIYNSFDAVLTLNRVEIQYNEALGQEVFFTSTDDTWQRPGIVAGDLIFAYADTQNSSGTNDSGLSAVLNDFIPLDFDDDDAALGGSVIAGAVASVDGTASFNVFSFGFETAVIDPYQLYVSVVNPSSAILETEFNDSRETADVIDDDRLVIGGFSDEFDEDFYSFTAQAGDRIVVMLDNDPDDDALFFTASEIAILDANGDELNVGSSGFFFDGDAGAAGAVTASQTGTYYVRIRNLGLGDDDYRFVIQTLPASARQNEVEPNQEFEPPTLLPPGRFGQGDISTDELTSGGGGIFNEGILDITNRSFIHDNFARNETSGGGIVNLDTLTMTESFLFKNSAENNGGGLANFGDATLNQSAVGDVADNNDFWVRRDGTAGRLVFAYVDTQQDPNANNFGASLTETSDSVLEVLGNDGLSLLGSDDNDGPGADLRGQGLSSVVAGVSIQDRGNVFFNVRSSVPGVLPLEPDYQLYTAIVDPAQAINEAANNGTPGSTSQLISTNRLITGVLSNPEVPGTLDTDVFRITANVGDRIVVMLDADPNRTEAITLTELSILNSSGEVLTGNINPQNDSDPANAVGAVTATASGNYFIRIRDLDLAQGRSYRFVVLVMFNDPTMANVVDESNDELNNTPKAAVALLPNQFGTGVVNVLAPNNADLGGGVFNAASGNFTANQTTIGRNTALIDGGGLFNQGTATLSQSTVENNSSGGNGGGVFSTGELNLTNATISNNSAGLDGGGLHLTAARIRHSTIAENSANENGGGLYHDGLGTLALFSTILATNTAAESGDIQGQAASDSRFNLIGDGTGLSGIVNGGNGNLIGGTDGPIINPLLGPLLANGGPTRTHALLSGSPAFEAGPDINAFNQMILDELALGNIDFNLRFDQRGTPNVGNLADLDNFLFLRLVGTRVDIGAFELQAVDGSSDDILVAGNDEGQFNEVLIFSAITTKPLGDSIDPRFLPDPGSELPSGDSPSALGLGVTTGPRVGVSGFSPYSPGRDSGLGGLRISVRVAVGDINGDGFDDIVTAPGPGGGPHIKVFYRTGGRGTAVDDVNRFATMSGDINFFAYSALFGGGVYLAVADINGDGFDDIITAPDAGGGPHVRIFLGAPTPPPPGQSPQEFFGFFAYSLGFTGGVRVATGDVTGDGILDIITAPGAGGGPHIRVFDGRNGRVVNEFFAYVPSVFTGVFLAAGDVNGDRRADIITSPGNGGGSHIQVYDGLSGKILSNFFAYSTAFFGGARVAAGDFNQDGLVDILTTPGFGGGPHLRFFDAKQILLWESFYQNFPGKELTAFQEFFGQDAVRFVATSPLFTTTTGAALFLTDDGEVPDPVPGLTNAELQALREAAFVRLESAGVSSEVLLALEAVPIIIQDLSGGTLGFFTGTSILIDINAARFGWFVDPTPSDDGEFFEESLDNGILGRFDLLTVILHELAHAAGHAHIEGEEESSNHLLLATLPVSQRRNIDSEALEAIFSNADFTAELLSSLESSAPIAVHNASNTRNRSYQPEALEAE